MQKVLIITYYWPPAGGPGVQRWLKFTKYLVEKGYDVHVYVPDNPAYPLRDEALQKDVPKEAKVVKQPIFEPYALASFFGRKHVKTISSGVVPDDKKQSLVQRFMLWVRGNLFIPDARLFWVKPSVRFLSKYVQANDIQTIITSGPPHSLHLIGMQLKEKHNLRWLADFRDPWTTIEYHDKLKLSAYAQKRHKQLEKQVLHAADDVIVTSPLTVKEFQALTHKPVHLITNGFDSEVKKSNDLDEKFTLAHIGSLLSSRNPHNLWKAISACKKDLPGFANDLSIVLIGVVSEEVKETLFTYGLEAQVQLMGYLSHEEVVVHQAKSQVLLLIEANNPVKRCILPGKVFEYMSAGRPIVAFGVDDSDIQHIIEKSEAGKYFTYDQFDAIVAHITALYKAYKAGQLSVGTKGIDAYHRSQLTNHLIDIIENPTKI